MGAGTGGRGTGRRVDDEYWWTAKPKTAAACSEGPKAREGRAEGVDGVDGFKVRRL